MKPLLPTFDKLEPYLKRIDENRYYTNVGPLCLEYEKRLEGLFGAPCITGSSATSLLTATLMAYDLPRNSLVAMPSYTFPATAAAVVSAGLVPYFCDVNENGIMESYYDKTKAIIIVAAFGYPVDFSTWELLHNTLRIPVIIDAAAGFDAFSTVCKPVKCPVVISTHATKTFSTAEGGFVTCHDQPLLEKIRRITNFGLSPERRIEYTGLNAKFSEYHAAVGLASLDEWPEKRLKLLHAVKPYGLDYAITQIPVRGQGVKGRYGCHFHDAYKNYPRTDLPITEVLIKNVGTVMIGID
jgi:dTDP-4-amino-4,6-dideoxygalactose transaminase